MKPEWGITEEKIQNGFKVILIDTKKASYKGEKLNDLGVYSRRKFENLLILSRAHERLKIIYSDQEYYVPSSMIEPYLSEEQKRIANA